MTQQKLTFENENLIVDYITLNVRDLDDPKLIAKYLSTFGFNSSRKEHEKDKGRPLLPFKKENCYQVQFIKSTYDPPETYWGGFKIRFSGGNGKFFYSLVKEKVIDWDIFDLTYTQLGRFEVHYLSKFSDPTVVERRELKNFFENCKKKIKLAYPKRFVKVEENKDGLIFIMGERDKNSVLLLMYEKPNYLEFELELLKNKIKSHQDLFFSYKFETFETKIAMEYYKQLEKLLVLDTYHVEWLILKLRRNRYFSNKPVTNSLVSDYINLTVLNSLPEPELFYLVLQFLSFIRSLRFVKYNMYYEVEFFLCDFLKSLNISTNNHYRRTKFIDMLNSLQDLTIKKTYEKGFSSSIWVPYFELNPVGKYWVVNIMIHEDIYLGTSYPFQFPEHFLTYKRRTDLTIKLAVISAVAQNPLQKRFLVEDFLKKFNFSNQDTTNLIKDNLIQCFQILEKK